MKLTSLIKIQYFTKTQKILVGILVIILLLTPLLHLNISIQTDEALALDSSSYDSGFEEDSFGEVEYPEEGSYRIYGDFDSDGDAEWSSSYDSGFETYSTEECGGCTDTTFDTTETDTTGNITYDTCSDQCSYSGQAECTDSNSYHVCGDYDYDSCLEWGVTYDCGYNETCQNGQCVQDTPTCTDQCSYNGQKDCSGNSGRTCGDHDSDSCLEWSSWENCASYCYYCGDGNCDSSCGESSYTCSQDCGPSCTDQCSYNGQKECANSNSYHVCNDYDSDPCLEWGSTNYCDSNETCQNGECVTQCTSQDHKSCYNNDIYWYDSCGSREDKYRDCGSDYCENWSSDYCSGGNVYKKRTCYDKGCSNSSCYSNPSTDKQLVESCGYNETCQNGQCVQDTPTCTDQCSYNGQKDCSGNSGRTCGDHDSDSCLEWSSWENCASYCYYCGDGNCDSSCGESSYTCSQDCGPSCTDQCSYNGQKECANSNSYHVCNDYNSDPCLEWGSVTYCSSDETCQSGECVKENQPPKASFSFSPSNLNVNDNIQFSDQSFDSDGWVSSYSWSFGDGSRSYQTNPSHSYANSGSYTVSLTVTDNDGRTDSTSRTISIETDCTSQAYKSCSNNDVYWYDSCNNRGNKYRDCGSDYCENWSSDYCSGGDVYQKRTCYDKGCAGNSCYSDSYTDRRLRERCDSDETCQSGDCIEERECSSGPCCENGQYKSSNEVCDTERETEYGCPWGDRCGADLGKRTRTRERYCSGSNASCTGSWSNWSDWSSWSTAENCSSNQICSATDETCQYSSACRETEPSYTRCYNGDLYWYNAQGVRRGLYRTCDDNNSCTVDGCTDGSCSNNPSCDGSTCEIGSSDYCASCEHCGDGICNCEETMCSCPQDCEEGDLVVSISAKETQQTTEWQKDLLTSSNQKVDFLVTVTNSGPDMIRNIDLKADLSGFIIYKDDIKSEGRFISGDITQGITLDQLQSKSTRNYTFKGKTQNVDQQKQVNVIANAETEELSDADSIKIKIKKGLAFSDNPLVAALQGITRAWYGWPLVILLVLATGFILSRILKRRKETEQS